MTVRTKTFVTVVLSTIALVCAAFLVSAALLLRRAWLDDEAHVREAVLRSVHLLEHEATQLGATTVDWSSWDDTYAYVQDHNQAYVDDNLQDETFDKNRFGFLCIVDTEGRFIFGKAYDLFEKKATPLPTGLTDHLKPGMPLISHRDERSSLDGLLVLPDEVVMIASRPILTSQRAGPIQGTLCIGRVLVPEEILRLESLAGHRLSANRVQDSMPVSRSAAAPRPTAPASPSTVLGIGRDTMRGIRVLQDIYDVPTLTLSADMPRTASQGSVRSLAILFCALTVIGIALTAVTLISLDRLVLSRLRRLHDFLQGVRSTDNLSSRIQVSGHDELSALTQSVNDALSALERDALERAGTQKALAASEERYRALITKTTEGVWRGELDSPIPISLSEEEQVSMLFERCSFAEINEAMARMYGLDSPEDLVGTRIGDLLGTSISNREIVREFVRSGYSLTDSESTEPDRNGHMHQFLNNVVGIVHEGHLIRIWGLQRDITDLKRAEEERRRLHARILEGQKLESLGILAGGIAHDFNNLLMSILGNLEVAEADLPPGSAEWDSVEGARMAALRAADLCKQLLAYSGKETLVMRPLNLNLLIQEMSQILLISLSRKSAIRCRLADDLPPVMADGTQIRQMLMNLIINASEAIGDAEGIVSISTGVMSHDRPALDETFLGQDLPTGDYVFLQVSDSGCGMDESTLPRIFEPFFTTKFAGRGLGLSALLGNIRGHGGAVKVESEKGKGSLFRLLFPVANAKGESPEPPSSPSPAPLYRSGEGRTVLLVDDEEGVLQAVERMLRRLGYEVLTAHNGREALTTFEYHHQRIDCILMDLTMPVMSGEEALTKLRRLSPKLPILLASGFSEQVVHERLSGQRYSGLIMKPYEISTLSSALRKALHRDRMLKE